MFLMLAIIAAFANLLTQTSFGISSEKLTERVRAVVFQAILRQDVGKANKFHFPARSLCPS